MGENAEEILASTNISTDDRKKYDPVLAKFDTFFQVRKNIIFKRAQFNRHSQQPDKSAETFITSLCSLYVNCAYCDLRDQMIRDRIVVGICDNALSERLQLDPKLTLEKVKALLRQCEAVPKQHAVDTERWCTKARVNPRFCQVQALVERQSATEDTLNRKSAVSQG